MSKKWKKGRGGPASVIVAAGEPTEFRICGASEPLELLAAADGDAKKLRKFSMTAYTGVPMQLPGFFHAVIVDLAGLKIPSQARPILRDHDTTQIVGHTETIDASSQRLKVAGVISGVGAAAQEVAALAANNFPWQASIGASVQKMEFIEAGKTAKVNGRVHPGPINVARQTTLGEVSFVAIGADPNTAAKVAAQNPNGPNGAEKMSEFDVWLKAKGFDRAMLSDVQIAALEAAWKTETNPTAPVTKPGATNGAPAPAKRLTEIIEAQRREDERQVKITELVAEAIKGGDLATDTADSIGQLAITGNWDIQQTELEILRARRPRHTGLFRQAAELPDDGQVIEAAVCSLGNLPNLEAHYGERTLEAAHKRWKHGLGLGELILTFARKGGYSGMTMQGGLRSALQAAFRAEIRAGVTGPSTYTLPDILSNVANKFMAAGFNAVDNAWRMITAIRSVRDFKQITSHSLTGDLTYEKVAPGGELQHGTLDDTKYTNQADTYGRLLGLDRRDLINDDLGALTSAGTRLGRGGAIKLNKVFWAEFLDNSTFFAAGNNNVLTGAGSALALAGLEDADEKFRLQTDPDGNPLGIMPRKLLVPTALRVTALNLMNSTHVQSGSTAAGGIPDQNPFAGQFDVVSSPYMQDSTLTGNSAAAWYLLAAPEDLAVIETCFLNGQESPTVETADMDFNTLGIALRGFHDFGVNLQEFRAGVRSAGS